MKVPEYKVISGNPKSDFEEKIKQSLTEGWQPLGGVSTLQMDIPPQQGQKLLAVAFSQAMVKHE